MRKSLSYGDNLRGEIRFIGGSPKNDEMARILGGGNRKKRGRGVGSESKGNGTGSGGGGGGGSKAKCPYQCVGYWREDHGQPIFGVSVNHHLDNPVVFATVGNNR